MYKEKLKTYIDNSPLVEFIINTEDGNFVKVEFNKDKDNYFFIGTEIQRTEDDSYKDISSPYTLTLDMLDEDICKVFVEKFEAMILEEYNKKKLYNE